jgi:hypothetical protein
MKLSACWWISFSWKIPVGNHRGRALPWYLENLVLITLSLVSHETLGHRTDFIALFGEVGQVGDFCTSHRRPRTPRLKRVEKINKQREKINKQPRWGSTRTPASGEKQCGGHVNPTKWLPRNEFVKYRAMILNLKAQGAARVGHAD